MKQGVLEGFIDRVSSSESLDDLEKTIGTICSDIGLQHLVYHWINAKGELFGAGTYTTEWRDHYLDRNYQRVDPVVRSAAQHFHPLDWRKLDWSGKAVQTFQDEAVNAGVGPNGLTFPIRGPNGQFAHFTATQEGSEREWEHFSEENARHLILLGHFFNQTALEISGAAEADPSVSLSPREIDALSFLALGYTRSQTADSLSISEHTLRVYIESARFKLQCMNTTHSVAKAMKLGLLMV